jgi:HEAT repeat protein
MAYERQGAVVMAFYQIRSNGVAAVPRLAAALRNPATSANAAHALEAVGPAAAPVLKAALADPSPCVRLQAAGALSHLEPGALSGWGLAYFQDSAPGRTCACVGDYIMGELAPRAVVPAAIEHCASPDPAIRANAADALGQFGSMYRAAALEALERALADPSAHVRNAATNALGQLRTSGVASR